jgi:hypothetical protein
LAQLLPPRALTDLFLSCLNKQPGLSLWSRSSRPPANDSGPLCPSLAHSPPMVPHVPGPLPNFSTVTPSNLFSFLLNLLCSHPPHCSHRKPPEATGHTYKQVPAWDLCTYAAPSAWTCPSIFLHLLSPHMHFSRESPRQLASFSEPPNISS